MILGIKMFFSEERKEMRRLKKAIKFEQMFQQEYKRLEKKKILVKLKADIREHENKERSNTQAYGIADSVSSLGRSLKQGLDTMSSNYRYNSIPLKKQKHRRYQVNSPMGFALMPMDKRQ